MLIIHKVCIYIFQLPQTEQFINPHLSPQLKNKTKTKTAEAYEQILGITLHFSPPVFFTSPDSSHLVSPIPVHSILITTTLASP